MWAVSLTENSLNQIYVERDPNTIASPKQIRSPILAEVILWESGVTKDIQVDPYSMLIKVTFLALLNTQIFKKNHDLP